MLQHEKIDIETQVMMAELDGAIEQKIGDKRKDKDVLDEFPDMPGIPDDLFIE